MAISYFPNRIRVFPTRRNLLDDVDANDINSIQAELTAIADPRRSPMTPRRRLSAIRPQRAAGERSANAASGTNCPA